MNPINKQFPFKLSFTIYVPLMKLSGVLVLDHFSTLNFYKLMKQKYGLLGGLLFHIF